MSFDQVYQPKRKNFWNKPIQSLNKTETETFKYNPEFYKEYTKINISVESVINNKHIIEYDYQNEMVILTQSIEQIEKIISSRILNDEKKKYITDSKVYFNGELIVDKKQTINELIANYLSSLEKPKKGLWDYIKNFRKTEDEDDYMNFEKNLNILLFFSKDSLKLVEKKHLPIIDSKFEIKPSKFEICRMNYEQISNVPNFEIFNKHGKIEFLVPVDLTEVVIDEQQLQINSQNISFSDELENRLLSKRNFLIFYFLDYLF
jgi:hypothetical protein